MDRAVFLDRDGTLLDNQGDLGDPNLVKLIQGAPSAIASFRGLGYKVIVVTNQGGVARGKYTEDDVKAVHRRINDLARANSGAWIDRFYYCPYHPEGTVEKYAMDHPWRKPQPGMVLQAAEDLKLNLSKCWMIGDQPRDMQAGREAGLRTILLRDVSEPAPGGVTFEFLAPTLIEAVRLVAQQRRPESEPQFHVVTTIPPGPSEPAATPAGRMSVSGLTTREFGPLDRPTHSETRVASSLASERPEHRSPTMPIESARSSRTKLPSAEHTLRQILHELRNQRTAGSDFSYIAVVAMVLQMVAAVCLLAALFLGLGDLPSFVRWMLAALLFQLATIAILMFRR